MTTEAATATERTVPFTTDLPASVVHDLKVACATRGIKIKDAAAEAVALRLTLNTNRRTEGAR